MDKKENVTPVNENEYEQVGKIKSNSKDSYNMIDTHQKLEKVGIKPELFDFDRLLDIQNDISPTRVPKNVRYKRKEDEFEFPLKKSGFFLKLIWLFSKNHLFKQKYPDTGLVKTSFFSLLLYGNGFVLGKYAQNFVLEYIIKWQELLKPVLKEIYKSGWRTKNGKLLLSPKEFNIIGTCERLVNAKGIAEILFKPKNTLHVFNKSCLFLNYYYQIIQAGPNILISSFIKAMRSLTDDIDLFKNYIEEYCDHIFNFFDGRVEKSFIIPLLEAMSGDTLVPEQAKANSRITLLEQKEYRAHEQLNVIMKAREENYNKKIKKIIQELEIESAFLEPISKDIQFKYKIEDNYYSPIDFALKTLSKENSEHCIKNMHTLIEFFDKYYAPILIMRIPIRMEGNIEYAKIFTKEVFSESYSKILVLKIELEKYFDTPFAQCIKLDPSKENEQINDCIKIVAKICDHFFNIGKKLYRASSSIKFVKTSFRPIDPVTLGKINIPYHDRTIYSQNKENETDVYSLNGRIIKNVIQEIRVFCMCFVTGFEPPFRYTIGNEEDKKKKTLDIRIISKDEIKSILERFKFGEEIDILLQSYL